MSECFPFEQRPKKLQDTPRDTGRSHSFNASYSERSIESMRPASPPWFAAGWTFTITSWPTINLLPSVAGEPRRPCFVIACHGLLTRLMAFTATFAVGDLWKPNRSQRQSTRQDSQVTRKVPFQFTVSAQHGTFHLPMSST